MSEQTDAFRWILEAKTVPELQDVAKKIEASFMDVGFAKHAYQIRFYELTNEAGLTKVILPDRTIH